MNRESGKILNPKTNRLVSATGRIGRKIVATASRAKSVSPSPKSPKSASPSPTSPTKFDDIPNNVKRTILNYNVETVRAIRMATKKFNNLLSATGKENGKYLSQYFKSLVNAPPLPQHVNLYASDLILIPTPESKLPQITLGYNQWNQSHGQRFDIFMSHRNLKQQPIIRTNDAGHFWVLSRDANEINKDLSDVLDNLSKVEVIRGNKQNSIIEEWNKSLITNSKKSK
jgi:hypothetical protein